MQLQGEQEIRLHGGTHIPWYNLQATREQEREKSHADYTEAICKNRVIMRFVPIFNVWFKKKIFAGFRSLPRAAIVQK